MVQAEQTGSWRPGTAHSSEVAELGLQAPLRGPVRAVLACVQERPAHVTPILPRMPPLLILLASSSQTSWSQDPFITLKND